MYREWNRAQHNKASQEKCPQTHTQIHAKKGQTKLNLFRSTRLSVPIGDTNIIVSYPLKDGEENDHLLSSINTKSAKTFNAAAAKCSLFSSSINIARSPSYPTLLHDNTSNQQNYNETWKRNHHKSYKISPFRSNFVTLYIKVIQSTEFFNKNKGFKIQIKNPNPNPNRIKIKAIYGTEKKRPRNPNHTPDDKIKKEIRGSSLELVGELPHVRVDPGEGGEGHGPDPYVHESLWIRVGNARISAIGIPKILLHLRRCSRLRLLPLVRHPLHSLSYPLASYDLLSSLWASQIRPNISPCICGPKSLNSINYYFQRGT